MVEQQGRPAWGGRRAQRLTAEVLARDYSEQLGYTPCHWCGKPATTFDHWPIARTEGGPDTLENGKAACRPCNTARGVALWEQRRRPALPSRRW
jgi:5-methylcytosine-specific restriction endonuclease McrA